MEKIFVFGKKKDYLFDCSYKQDEGKVRRYFPFILKQYCTCSLIAVVLVSGSIFSHSQKIGGRFLQFELFLQSKSKRGKRCKNNNATPKNCECGR